MPGTFRNLPPLTALRSFEAAARHENFTEAAAELFVTQAAISKQVRLLEQHLGVQLFNRNGRNLTLTADGRDLQHTVSKGLAQIAKGSEKLLNDNRENRIAIAMRLPFANTFLTSRLSRLFQSFPGVEFKFQTTERNPADLMDSVDLAVVLGHEPQPHIVADHLITEVIVPVCSPGYLERNPAARDANELPNQTLLHLDSEHWRALDWSEAGWTAFFDHIGVSHAQDLSGASFNNFEMLINAACDGLGIAIGWHYLVDHLVSAGQLVRPVGLQYQIDRRHYLLCRREQANREVFVHLRQWFLDETSDFR